MTGNTYAPGTCSVAGCAAAPVRFLPGKRRTFYCAVHGPMGRPWSDLVALPGAVAPTRSDEVNLDGVLAAITSMRGQMLATLDRFSAAVASARDAIREREAELAEAMALLDDATRPAFTASDVLAARKQAPSAISAGPDHFDGEQPTGIWAEVDAHFNASLAAAAAESATVPEEPAVLRAPLSTLTLAAALDALLADVPLDRRHRFAPAPLVAYARASKAWTGLSPDGRAAVLRALHNALLGGSSYLHIPGRTVAGAMRHAAGLAGDAHVWSVRANSLRLVLTRDPQRGYAVAAILSRADSRVFSRES